MSIYKIIILRGTARKAERRPDTVSVSIEELRRGGVFKYILRYRRAELWVPQLDVLFRPFISALLLRVVCRGQCSIVDDREDRLYVSLPVFIRLFLQMIMGAIRQYGLERRTLGDIDRLMAAYANGRQNALDLLSGTPVYLRSDITFSMRAGGSVGHTAGVLNNLQKATGKAPVFITTDPVPTVRPEIETHVTDLPPGFWDFPEMLPLAHNNMFPARVHALLGGRRPAFIYQRYSAGNFAGLKLARAYCIPLILEFNGSEIWVARNWWTTPLKRERLYEAIEMLNLRAADVVVVVSRALEDGLLARGIGSEKILINPNGVDPEQYSPQINGTKVRQRYGLKGKTVIGFIGTFGRWHGAEVLADAFGRLIAKFPAYHDTLRLLMIGDGPMMPMVREQLASHGVTGLCIFTGLVPQAQGPEYLAACDIYASPHVPNPDGTPFFGSPTKLFEYMAMGRGIVASALEQIGEVLEHNRTAWLTAPGDPDDLARGLKTLIDDPVRRQRLGAAAREEVIARYTWEKHTQRIIEKLRECCESAD